MSDRGTLRRVGAIWKPKPGAKSLGSGELSIDGMKQPFIVLKNDRKKVGSKQPDYLLVSSDAPVEDAYARDRYATPPRDDAPEREPLTDDDDIPF
jgi:hypothetical protein